MRSWSLEWGGSQWPLQTHKTPCDHIFVILSPPLLPNKPKHTNCSALVPMERLTHSFLMECPNLEPNVMSQATVMLQNSGQDLMSVWWVFDAPHTSHTHTTTLPERKIPQPLIPHLKEWWLSPVFAEHQSPSWNRFTLPTANCSSVESWFRLPWVQNIHPFGENLDNFEAKDCHFFNHSSFILHLVNFDCFVVFDFGVLFLFLFLWFWYFYPKNPKKRTNKTNFISPPATSNKSPFLSPTKLAPPPPEQTP